jgi:hypothetical protein
MYLDKRIFIVFLFCLPIFRTHYVAAQTHIGLGYYDFNSTSRNIVLWADKTYKRKHVLGVGIKYHFDDPIRSDFSNGLDYRTISADKWYQRLGFMMQYQKKVLWNNKIFKPFLFYNFQGTYGFQKQDGFYDWVSGRWQKQLLVNELCLFENQMGVGLDLHLSKKLRFYLNAGIGLVFYWNMNQPLVEKKFLKVTSTSRDWDRMFSGGIKYELIPPPKKITNKNHKG